MIKYLNNIVIICMIFLFAKPLYSFEYEIPGYIYESPSVQIIPDTYKELTLLWDNPIEEDYIFVNQLRARIKPKLEIGDSEILMHYEVNSIYSKFSMLGMDNPSKTNRQLYDLNWELINEDKVNINHYIDRLYFRQNFDWGDFTLGRQRVAWGTGRIWQKTDLFNQINPANFSKIEKDGADAISSNIFLGDFTSLNAVVNFVDKDDFGNTNYALRFQTNYSEYDLSFLAGSFDNELVLGADFSGNFFDAGLRGEILYSQKEELAKDEYFQIVLGMDNQFTEDFYGLIEYHYNGLGADKKENYLNLFAQLLNGEIQNLGKNYIAIQAMYNVHPLINLNIMNISNIDDKSGFCSFGGSYEFSEDINMGLMTALFYGSTSTEYSYYGSSIYFTAEYYF